MSHPRLLGLRQRWHEMSRLAHGALAIAAAGIVVLVGVMLAFFTLPAIGWVSARALTYSLTREAEGDLSSTELYTCKRRSASTYRCEVGETDAPGPVPAASGRRLTLVADHLPRRRARRAPPQRPLAGATARLRLPNGAPLSPALAQELQHRPYVADRSRRP